MSLLSACEAASLSSAARRVNSPQGISTLKSALICVRRKAESGERSCVLEKVGEGVELMALVAELQLLGYRARAAGPEEGYADRSVVLDW